MMRASESAALGWQVVMVVVVLTTGIASVLIFALMR